MSSGETVQIVGRHYRTGEPVQVDVRGETIASVWERPECAAKSTQAADTLPWLAPGFIDIQSNGYGGQEFSSAELTVDKVAAIAAQQAAFGVTGFCPTVTTASFETIVHSMRYDCRSVPPGEGRCGARRAGHSPGRPLPIDRRRATWRPSAGPLPPARLGRVPAISRGRRRAYSHRYLVSGVSPRRPTSFAAQVPAGSWSPLGTRRPIRHRFARPSTPEPD